jgi:hypothetical protein
MHCFVQGDRRLFGTKEEELKSALAHGFFAHAAALKSWTPVDGDLAAHASQVRNQQ